MSGKHTYTRLVAATPCSAKPICSHGVVHRGASQDAHLHKCLVRSSSNWHGVPEPAAGHAQDVGRSAAAHSRLWCRFVSNISIILLNKLLLAQFGFRHVMQVTLPLVPPTHFTCVPLRRYPIFLTACHVSPPEGCSL